VPQPGRYGRRPPKRARAMQFARWRVAGAPLAYPPAEDYLARLGGGWLMLGNDAAGDCVPITWANMRRLVTTLLAPPGYYPTQAMVWRLYETQNAGFDPAGTAQTNGPGSQYDNGMDIQTLLERLVSVGGADGVKALCFGAVNLKDPDEVKAAIAAFGSVWTGVNVLAANLTQFGAGQPWDLVPGSPADGGHSILTGGYGTPGPGPLGGDERFITWAAETSFTDAYWAAQCEEAWVVVWPEHLGSRAFEAGIDIQALAADFHQLTGGTLDLPGA
jgi:hypothetical protein